MKKLVHKQNDTSVCIYELNDTFIRGSFFKEKPDVGDVIMSHTSREGNFLYMYLVEKIIENKDVYIQSGCNYDPMKASFKIAVRLVTSEDFPDIDNSIVFNLS